MANLSNINNKLIVSDGGHLLINQTANANYVLQMDGLDGTVYSYFKSNVATTGARIGLNSDDLRVFNQQASGELHLGTAGTTRLTIDASGNVGIGKSPTEKLDVEGNIQAINTAGSSVAYVDVVSGGTWRLASNPTTGTNAYGLDIIKGSAGTDIKMSIDTNGNVGIGTTSPADKLTVNGNIITQGGDTNTGYDRYLKLYGNSDPATNSHRWAGLAVYNNGGNNVNELAFFAGIGDSARTERMRIDSGGSVIIGDGATSGTPAADYRSLEIGRQGNTITGAPWKSNLYFSTNATVTGGSTAFTYRYASVAPTQMTMEAGVFTWSNAVAGTVGNTISWTERMRVTSDGVLQLTQSSGADGFLNTDGTNLEIDINRNPATGAISDSSKGCARIQLRAEDGGAGSRIIFGTASANNTTATERMRITSGGVIQNATINSSVTSALRISNNAGSGNFTYGMSIEDDSSNTGFILFAQADGTAVGTITRSGTSTVYATSSDYRLKDNVVEMTGALDRVSQLKPSRFNFIADADKVVDGFLAHEVQEIVPEAITGEKDAVDEEGNPEYQGIDQSKLVPLLVGAIQELKADNDILKARIETLENK